tara:strand:+ start:81 stop:389 length:309 start_codon:yes stop_codon:yes gene_type:complete
MLEKIDKIQELLNVPDIDASTETAITNMKILNLLVDLRAEAEQLTLTDVVLCLSKEEKDLIVEGLNSAIAICDWDNYQKEKYESPKAQVSWYYGLIEKLNKA